jgi:hypothetical protein
MIKLLPFPTTDSDFDFELSSGKEQSPGPSYKVADFRRRAKQGIRMGCLAEGR